MGSLTESASVAMNASRKYESSSVTMRRFMITVGTKSSNGFADLAQYDEDGNGWIDENDAICLQNVSTDYTRKSQTGQTPGAVRYSGAFLYENGDCGTIQHVDVAKYAKEA